GTVGRGAPPRRAVAARGPRRGVRSLFIFAFFRAERFPGALHLRLGRAGARLGALAAMAGTAPFFATAPPEPAPALERRIAHAPESEAAEQRAPRVGIKAERGGERGIDRKTGGRAGLGFAFLGCCAVVMRFAAGNGRGRRRGGLHSRGMGLARELFRHVDAQPPRRAAPEAGETQTFGTAVLLKDSAMGREFGHRAALLCRRERGPPTHRFRFQELRM